jgi:hypothetical protein
VRRQLLPDAAVDELGWAVYGRTPFASWVPGVLVDTFNRITGPGEVGMSVATCRALEPVASATARLAPSVHLTDIPGYFSWTLPLTDPRLFQADAASLHRSAAALVEGWHPARHVTRPRRWRQHRTQGRADAAPRPAARNVWNDLHGIGGPRLPGRHA